MNDGDTLLSCKFYGKYRSLLIFQLHLHAQFENSIITLQLMDKKSVTIIGDKANILKWILRFNSDKSEFSLCSGNDSQQSITS